MKLIGLGKAKKKSTKGRKHEEDWLKLFELISLRSQLECWNTGMMECWVLEKWIIGFMHDEISFA